MQIDPSHPDTHAHTFYYATYTRNHQSALWNMCKSIMQIVSIHGAVIVLGVVSKSVRAHHHALCYAICPRNHQSARWNMCGQSPNAPRGRMNNAQLQAEIGEKKSTYGEHGSSPGFMKFEAAATAIVKFVDVDRSVDLIPITLSPIPTTLPLMRSGQLWWQRMFDPPTRRQCMRPAPRQHLAFRRSQLIFETTARFQAIGKFKETNRNPLRLTSSSTIHRIHFSHTNHMLVPMRIK